MKTAVSLQSEGEKMAQKKKKKKKKKKKLTETS